MRILQRLFAALIVAALLPLGATAQQRGIVTGRVTDAATGSPLVGATVTVAGTALGNLTDQQGQYRIANVPAGPREITASVLGYGQQRQTVSVSAGGTVTANFGLDQTALEIGGVVVTASGQEQRTRELGNTVSTIDVEDVELAAVTSMSDLIQGRSAGTVVLQSSGVTGTGSRIRIRGSNSMSLDNNPLIIIDGVRVYDAEERLGFGVGGQTPSSIDDLNPEDIQSIEILKGPAAAALYGTAAANGVIQITTRRGRAGTADVRAWTEYGMIERAVTFPENVLNIGTLVGSEAATGRCDIIRQALANENATDAVTCTGVTTENRFNPLEASTSPLEDGNRQVAGASVSGGGETATFYVSGEYEDETGILPQNGLRRMRVQANASGNVGENLDIGANMSFLESDLQIPQSDNALFGIFPMGLYGLPTESNIETNDGFLADPQFAFDWMTFQDLSRFTGSVHSEFRPINWLALNGLIGLDRYAREEVNRLPRNTVYGAFGPPFENGFIQNFDYDIYNLTANGSATAVFNLSDDLVSTTTVGTQYLRETLHRVYAFGSVLTPGVEESLAGATAFHDAFEDNTLNATVSGYAQQQFGWRDRFFLNTALRGDQNTAFGRNLGWVWYPSVSASWVIIDEPFFPRIDALTHLRLRAAWGQSGLRPGPTDALQSFGPVIQPVAATGEAAPGIVFDEIGNPDLRPEVSTEWEAGFESGFLDDRLGLDFTYFHKTSEDALVSRRLAPSLGASTSRFENLGQVRNSGIEVLLNAQAIRTPDVQLDFTFSGSAINNELVELGQDAEGEELPDIIFGLGSTTQRHKEGFPLGSWFQAPITEYADANGDGLLSPGEVTVDSDTAVFLGNPFPDRELSISSNFSFRDWFRVSALLDYKGGHEILNFTHQNRCELPNAVCEDMYDPNTPLEVQAANVGWNVYGTRAGYVEDADFMKLREIAFTFSIPQSFIDRIGGVSAMNLTLAGRNLATWTDYSGFDPEVSYAGQSNFNAGDAGTLPPNTTYMIRIDANF